MTNQSVDFCSQVEQPVENELLILRVLRQFYTVSPNLQGTCMAIFRGGVADDRCGRARERERERDERREKARDGRNFAQEWRRITKWQEQERARNKVASAR